MSGEKKKTLTELLALLRLDKFTAANVGISSGLFRGFQGDSNTELLTCLLCLSGHSRVQEEAEASEDPHVGRHSEDRHGGRLQDCQ